MFVENLCKIEAAAKWYTKKRLIPRDMEIEQARIPQKQRTTGGNFF